MSNRKISRYFELIWFKSLGQLKSEVSRTYLNVLWWVLEPLILMSAYYIVFSHLLNLRTPEFALSLLLGLGVVRWFSACFVGSSFSIVSAHGLMNLVDINKIVFPLIYILSSSIKSLIVLFLIIFFIAFSKNQIHPFGLLILFLTIVGTGMCITGISLIFSSIVPFILDLKHLTSTISSLVLFMSGVFYSIDMLPVSIQKYFFLNPMACSIQLLREILISNVEPSLVLLLYLFIVGVVSIIVGICIICFFNKAYPRVVSK